MTTQLLGFIAIALLPTSLAYVVVRVLMDSQSGLRLWLSGYEAKLNAELLFLRMQPVGRRVLVLQTLGALGIAAFAVLITPLLGFLVPVAIFGPILHMRSLREKRVIRLEQQLDGWLLVLANALKAVPAIGDALSSSQALMHSPISEELDVALKEYRLGTPLDRALQNLGDRVGSRVVRTALTILQVARRTGGNLPQTLETSAASLRELARLEGVVRTKTADGKNQAYVIGALPGIVFMLLYYVHPDLLIPLMESLRGNIVLAIAIALWIGAIALTIQILKVDI